MYSDHVNFNKKILSVVEILKGFNKILFDQKLQILSDNKKMSNFNNNRKHYYFYDMEDAMFFITINTF